MTPLQLELTRLIGKKELMFGCTDTLEVGYFHNPEKQIMKIIGHPATLSDFHRWVINNNLILTHQDSRIYAGDTRILYDSSKDLLDQEEETLKQIVELISSNQ